MGISVLLDELVLYLAPLLLFALRVYSMMYYYTTGSSFKEILHTDPCLVSGVNAL